VQRRYRLQLADRLADSGVDDDGLAEARAAVHDSVARRHHVRRIDRRERVDPRHALVLLDQPELQARRPGVDDEDGLQ
jgi:hypothetical protein